MDLPVGELSAPRRHHVVLAVVDHRDHLLQPAAVQPDAIGQVGRAERLVALALTQIAINKAVVSVFVEFLSTGGPEIYLKPAGDYVSLDKPVNFYTVVESARRKGQSAIGYRLLAEAGASECAFGVHLNPEKSTTITFSQTDRIIVLAEA